MGKKKNVLTIKYKVRNTANDRGKYITPPVKRGKKKPIAKHP